MGKYEEALERAKAGKPIDEVFPELAESEDERIRKQCIKLLRASYTANYNANECIAWLEKQKESLHISKTCKEDADSFTDEDERIRKAIIELVKWVKAQQVHTDHFDNGIKWNQMLAYLEKQKEQPMELLEPDKNVKKIIEDVIRIYGKTQGEWVGGYDIDTLIVNLRRAFEQKEQKPKFYPGAVIKCTSSGSLWVRCKDGDNIRSDGHTACIGGGFELASEEEAVQFFQELNENGYQWDCIKGRPMQKEQKLADIKEERENAYQKGWEEALRQLPKEVDSQIWQIANNSAKTWEESFAILCAAKNAFYKGREDGLKEQKPAEKPDLVAELKHHLATTPKEQLIKEWEDLKKWSDVGPTVKEFLYGNPAELTEEMKTNLDRAICIIKDASDALPSYQSDDGVYECEAAIKTIEEILSN